jgi:hypothetical protein
MLCCKSPALTTYARVMFHPKWTLTVPSTNPRATSFSSLSVFPRSEDDIVIHHLAHTLLTSVRDQRPRVPNPSLKADRAVPHSTARKSCIAPSSARLA